MNSKQKWAATRIVLTFLLVALTVISLIEGMITYNTKGLEASYPYFGACFALAIAGCFIVPKKSLLPPPPNA